MNTTWSTRAGTGADRHAVHDLVHAAFGRPAEAGLVDALRDDPAWLDGLSLLATDAHGTPVGNDHLAHGALRALYEAGRSVPNDLDVVGFDDIEASPRAVTCHRAACCHSPPGHAVSPVIQPHVLSPVTRPRAVTRHRATRAEAPPPAQPTRTGRPSPCGAFGAGGVRGGAPGCRRSRSRSAQSTRCLRPSQVWATTTTARNAPLTTCW